MLVLLPECIDKFESEKININELPLLTKFILVSVILYSLIVSFWINSLYTTNASLFQEFLRKVIFLFHPIICLAWYPFQKTIKKKLLEKVIISFLIYSISLIIIHADRTLPNDFRVILTDSTAFLSSITLDIFWGANTISENNYYIFKSHKIIIHGGCAGFPQIAMVLQSLAIFWMCCPIKSKNYLLLAVVISTIITFLLNTIRISLLGLVIENYGENAFEFWHNGIGSLIFSLIGMAITSWIYYFLWCKENPLPNSEDQTAKDKK